MTTYQFRELRGRWYLFHPVTGTSIPYLSGKADMKKIPWWKAEDFHYWLTLSRKERKRMKMESLSVTATVSTKSLQPWQEAILDVIKDRQIERENKLGLFISDGLTAKSGTEPSTIFIDELEELEEVVFTPWDEVRCGCPSCRAERGEDEEEEEEEDNMYTEATPKPLDMNAVRINHLKTRLNEKTFAVEDKIEDKFLRTEYPKTIGEALDNLKKGKFTFNTGDKDEKKIKDRPFSTYEFDCYFSMANPDKKPDREAYDEAVKALYDARKSIEDKIVLSDDSEAVLAMIEKLDATIH